MTDTGDCFQVAAGFLRSGMIEEAARFAGGPVVYGEKSSWRIVHGLPIGLAGVVKGKRYWHAWVEYTPTDGTEPIVMDLSNGKDLRIPRNVYYKAGSLDEDHVWRFTPDEAKKLYRKTQHCGPWVKGWESMEDPTLQSA